MACKSPIHTRMQTRSLTRNKEISHAEELDTLSPVKKKRKLSLSLKKDKKLLQKSKKSDVKESGQSSSIVLQDSLCTVHQQQEMKSLQHQTLELVELEPSLESEQQRSNSVQLSLSQLTSEPVEHQQLLDSVEEQKLKLPVMQGTSETESYYLHSFKFILDQIVQSSPERHVIAAEGIPLVERFKQLSCELKPLNLKKTVYVCCVCVCSV